jgi:ankyrin repeat protein
LAFLVVLSIAGCLQRGDRQERSLAYWDGRDGEPLLFADEADVGKYVKLGLDVNIGVPDSQDQGRGILLFNAIRAAQTDVVSALIKAGANVNATIESFRFTPLHWAMGHVGKRPEIAVKIAQMLLKAGAKVNAMNKMGQTPLDIALDHESTSGDKTVSAFLVKHGARPGKSG